MRLVAGKCKIPPHLPVQVVPIHIKKKMASVVTRSQVLFVIHVVKAVRRRVQLCFFFFVLSHRREFKKIQI